MKPTREEINQYRKDLLTARQIQNGRELSQQAKVKKLVNRIRQFQHKYGHAYS